MFLLGLVLYAVLFLGTAMWMTQAQQIYLRLYQERGQERVPMLTENTDPWQFAANPFRLTWRSVRIVWTRQQDPELEQARRHVVRRLWLTVAVMFLGLAIPFVLGGRAS